MKHVWGYGILTVALAGALIWGYKRTPAPPVPPPPVIALWTPPGTGHDAKTDFLVDLMDKGRMKDKRELTDHAADNGKVLADGTSKLQTFTWKLDEPFWIEFDLSANPCQGATTNATDPTLADLKSTVDDPNATKLSYTATCTLVTTLPQVPQSNTTLSSGGTYKGFHYKVILNPPGYPANKAGPIIPTCDGCFVEID